MNRNDIERLLRDLAALPVETPDELTSARIASRWRSAQGGRPPTGQRRPLRSVAIGGAVALVAAAASVAVIVVADHPDDGRDLVVQAADGVTIELPDGQQLLAQGGEVLPEGALILGGAGASGLIGGIYVGPQSRFVVQGGRLEPQTERITPDTTMSPSPTDETATSATRAPQPTPSDPATSDTTSTTSRASGSVTTPTAAPRSRPAPPKRLAVEAESRPNGAQITWVAPSDTSVVRYVVVRAKKWNGRTLPRGRRIAQVRSNASLVAIDRKPQPGTFYVIAAYGPKNRLLAIGSVASPAA